jgi:hypothetical protein
MQLGSLADDMRVLTAMRLDHGQANLLEEMRAVNREISRLVDRGRAVGRQAETALNHGPRPSPR